MKFKCVISWLLWTKRTKNRLNGDEQWAVLKVEGNTFGVFAHKLLGYELGRAGPMLGPERALAPTPNFKILFLMYLISNIINNYSCIGTYDLNNFDLI